jgi:hypothetical protein
MNKDAHIQIHYTKQTQTSTNTHRMQTYTHARIPKFEKKCMNTAFNGFAAIIFAELPAFNRVLPPRSLFAYVAALCSHSTLGCKIGGVGRA